MYLQLSIRRFLRLVDEWLFLKQILLPFLAFFETIFLVEKFTSTSGLQSLESSPDSQSLEEHLRKRLKSVSTRRFLLDGS